MSILKNLIATVFLSVLMLFQSTAARAEPRDSVPSPLLGNWINTSTNDWEYGFYEDFAICQTAFWNYKSIKQDKKTLEILLEKDGKTLLLKVQQKEQWMIACNNGKYQPFRPYKNDFLPYPKKDETPFPAPVLKCDTVTIIGYYRNLDKLSGEAKKHFGSRIFSAAVADFVKDEEVNFFADMDSLGRFSLKIPVLTTQKIFLDWGRLTKATAIEPGETVMIYADIQDLLPRADDTRLTFYSRNKDILFMGKNARLHNEFAHATPKISMLDREEVEKNVSNDMDYLRKFEEEYHANVASLSEYLQQYPTLSKKTVTLLQTHYLYEFAGNLMQHRFSFLGTKQFEFDSPLYMEYVNKHFPFNNSPYYLAGSGFSGYVRDYLDYYKNREDGLNGLYVNSKAWLDGTINDLIERGVIPESERAEMEKVSELNQQIQQARVSNDTVKGPMIYRQNKALFDKINAYLSTDAAKRLMAFNAVNRDLQNIDTLIQDPDLRELQIARYFYKKIENTRTPLDSTLETSFEERVSNKDMLNEVLALNDTYKQVVNKTIAYEGSLKNTDHLKESKDADALFAELIAPYKGKVIYLDFWGTWCGPCRRQMPYSVEVEKVFAGKDVMFMYFANRSSEDSWKNIIKEYNISGENVVHYRLPDDQQAMLERKLGIKSFPTFMLLDKSGTIVNSKAPMPEMKDRLVDEITKLLAD